MSTSPPCLPFDTVFPYIGVLRPVSLWWHNCSDCGTHTCFLSLPGEHWTTLEFGRCYGSGRHGGRSDCPRVGKKSFRVSFEKSPGYPVSVGGVHDGPAGILKGCEKSRLGGSTGLGGQLLLFFLGSIELRISCFDQFVRRMLSCHLSQPNRDRNRGEITPV